jgi:transitional endoplasmic reticulum ATPase
MEATAGAQGVKGRVSAMAERGRRIYVDYPNNQTGWFEHEEPFDLAVGDVVLVHTTEGGFQIDPAPDELWPEEPWIGVIRAISGDDTIVSVGGLLRLLKTDDVKYELGNTVLGHDSVGIVRVLDPKPIGYLDLPGGHEGQDLEHFRFKPDPSGLKYADFGGYADVVSRAKELIELPLKYHQALAKIGARAIKGVMFTGLPGTGKTMLAQIIANEAGATFYTISGPQVFSKWFGESEQTLRRIFADASEQAPSIIFFDEIDSVATQRAESHEASRRVVAQLLTLMDGFESSSNVIVIAATNRPEDIDIALRRPGRFDWEIEFALPTLTDREEILRRSASHLASTGHLPHDLVAKQTEGWSSAEITAIWSEAALLAVADGRDTIIAEDYLGGHLRVSTQRRRLVSEAHKREPAQ